MTTGPAPANRSTWASGQPREKSRGLVPLCLDSEAFQQTDSLLSQPDKYSDLPLKGFDAASTSISEAIDLNTRCPRDELYTVLIIEDSRILRSTRLGDLLNGKLLSPTDRPAAARRGGLSTVTVIDFHKVVELARARIHHAHLWHVRCVRLARRWSL